MQHAIQRIGMSIDAWQRSHTVPAFIYAVIKKYVDDNAGSQAALLAYYGFLSLFPLLLLLVTLLRIGLHNDPHLSDQVLRAAFAYFPAVGRTLEQNIHTLGKTGPALAISLVLTLFGARAVADGLRTTLDNLWRVPMKKRATLPLAAARSLLIIIIGGLGAVVTPVAFSYLLSFAPNRLVGGLSVILTAAALYGVMIVIIKLGTSMPMPFHQIWLTALVAVIGLSLLQSIGGYIMARELQQMDASYGSFALVLSLLFWLYLQTQMLVLALEVDTVRVGRLWPRSLLAPLTPADKAADLNQPIQ